MAEDWATGDQTGKTGIQHEGGHGQRREEAAREVSTINCSQLRRTMSNPVLLLSREGVYLMEQEGGKKLDRDTAIARRKH